MIFMAYNTLLYTLKSVVHLNLAKNVRKWTTNQSLQPKRFKFVQNLQMRNKHKSSQKISFYQVLEVLLDSDSRV